MLPGRLPGPEPLSLHGLNPSAALRACCTFLFHGSWVYCGVFFATCRGLLPFGLWHAASSVCKAFSAVTSTLHLRDRPCSICTCVAQSTSPTLLHRLLCDGACAAGPPRGMVVGAAFIALGVGPSTMSCCTTTRSSPSPSLLLLAGGCCFCAVLPGRGELPFLLSLDCVVY